MYCEKKNKYFKENIYTANDFEGTYNIQVNQINNRRQQIRTRKQYQVV